MLEHIHKQQEQINNNIVKSYGVTASSNELQKGGKRATIGEVRTWGSEKWVKHADGWVHVHPTTSKATLEKPGGKREQASEDHVKHYNSVFGEHKGMDTEEKKHADMVKHTHENMSDEQFQTAYGISKEESKNLIKEKNQKLHDYAFGKETGGDKIPQKVKDILEGNEVTEEKSDIQEKVSHLRVQEEQAFERVKTLMSKGYGSRNSDSFKKRLLNEAHNILDKTRNEIKKIIYKQSEAKKVLKTFHLTASTKNSTAIRGYNTYSRGYEIDNKYDPSHISFHGLKTEQIEQISNKMKENGIRNSFDSSSITLMEHYDKDGKEIKEQNVQKSEIEQHQDLQKSRIASIYK